MTPRPTKPTRPTEPPPAPKVRTMLLTGCASGIGAHLTAALSRRGHRVMATDVNAEGLAAQARSARWDKDRVARHKLDVRRAADWESAFDAADRAFGRVDVLLNIAGVLKPGYVHELDLASVESTIDVNVKGTIYGTHAATRRMIARGSGHVVNFGSLASLAPLPGLAVYSASKFAVRGFTLAAAQELGAHNVSVTLVMLDAVATPMLELQERYEEAALTFSGSAPLTVHDVERLLVDEVLVNRPLEIALPAARGYLARIANVLPQAARVLDPILRAKGKKAQERMRHARIRVRD